MEIITIYHPISHLMLSMIRFGIFYTINLLYTVIFPFLKKHFSFMFA